MGNMSKGSKKLIVQYILMILFAQNPNALDFFMSVQSDIYKSHLFFWGIKQLKLHGNDVHQSSKYTNKN